MSKSKKKLNARNRILTIQAHTTLHYQRIERFQTHIISTISFRRHLQLHHTCYVLLMCNTQIKYNPRI